MSTNRVNPTEFISFLITSRIIPLQESLLAIDVANKKGIPQLSSIIEHELLSAIDASMYAHKEYNIPIADLNDFMPNILSNSTGIDISLCSEFHFVPLYININNSNNLIIGISDPTDMQQIKNIELHTGFEISTHVVNHDMLSIVLQKLALKEQRQAKEYINDESSYNTSGSPISSEELPLVSATKLLREDITQYIDLYENQLPKLKEFEDNTTKKLAERAIELLTNRKIRIDTLTQNKEQIDSQLNQISYDLTIAQNKIENDNKIVNRNIPWIELAILIPIIFLIFTVFGYYEKAPWDHLKGPDIHSK